MTDFAPDEQIIPAPRGWWAFFFDPGRPSIGKAKPGWFALPVIAWRILLEAEPIVWSERARRMVPASKLGPRLLLVTSKDLIDQELDNSDCDRPLPPQPLVSSRGLGATLAKLVAEAADKEGVI